MIDYRRVLVMACATVVEEMRPLFPEGIRHQVLDFGLHVSPARLRAALQEAISAAGEDIDTIILGYGLCSQAVVGIRSPRCTLVIPRVDDCIAIFLGSCAAYRQQTSAEPGTYYLTKGWIKAGDTPFTEYERMAARYGAARAERMTRATLAHYTRLALINTGADELEAARAFARRAAERFGLRYEEIEGSRALVRQMLFGPWDEGFIVAPPGEEIQYRHFFPMD